MTKSRLEKKVRIAVFDIDRTLIRGTSAEELLIHKMREEGMLSICRILANSRHFLLRLPQGLEKAAYYKSFYIENIRESDVLSLLPEFVETIILPRLSPSLMAFWPYLREAGYQIYLVSGTLSLIVHALVKTLQADGGIGSTLETENGVYTGHIVHPHPYNHGKPLALKHLLGNMPVQWEESFAFGDSWADVPLLSHFGCPVAVNPGFFMRMRVRKNGWMVLPEPKSASDPIQIEALIQKLHSFQSSGK